MTFPRLGTAWQKRKVAVYGRETGLPLRFGCVQLAVAICQESQNEAKGTSYTGPYRIHDMDTMLQFMVSMKYLKKLNLRFEKGDFKNPLKGQVREPAQIYGVFRDIKDWTKETLIGVYLNDKLELQSYEILTVGGASVTLVVPDEIFRGAILTNSKNFILIHNHPSGKAEPSQEDLEVIDVLREQSKVMRRSFLDFIIVGDDAYWSMFESMDGGEYALGGVA